MLIVLAGRQDVRARELVALFRKRAIAAELMLCVDVGRRGWRLGSDVSKNRIVVGSRILSCAALRGVVTRLVAVTPAELPDVHADDQAYAAAEMHAFLLAWLQSLSCPVLNHPQPGSLAGLPWSAEEWIALGARERIEVRPVARRWSMTNAPTPPSEPAELSAVHVVGDRHFGASDEAHGKAAVRLAKAAGAALLRVVFERAAPGRAPTLVGADHWVDVGMPEIAEAIARRCAS